MRSSTLIGRRGLLACSLGAAAATTAAPVQLPKRLPDFLALSSRLTGKRGLDPKIGEIYFRALLADPPASGVELEKAIIRCWYTGLYGRGDAMRSAGYRSALMWKAMGIPAPGSCHGRLGDWSQPLSRTGRLPRTSRSVRVART
ncbi:MAG: sugar dehydrogenase complex small subunit [Bryobacteraceae bacterium]